jgi:hypothetical protein
MKCPFFVHVISVICHVALVLCSITSRGLCFTITRQPKDESDERRVWNFHVETLSECEEWMVAFEIAGNQPAALPKDRTKK